MYEAWLVPIFTGGGFAASVLALRKIAYPAGTMADAPAPMAVRRRNAVFARMGFWGAGVPLALAGYGSGPHAGVLFVLAAAGMTLQLAWDGLHPAPKDR